MAGNEYWMKRLLRDRKLADRAADEVADRVKRSLRGQYLQTVRGLESLYAEARSRGELSRTKLWNYRRGLALEKQLREFVDEFSLFQEKEIRSVVDRVFRDTIGTDVDSFLQDKYILRYDPRAVIDTAWSGEHFSQRVWNNTNQLALRIRAEAEQVVLGEKGMGQIKRELMRDFNVGWNQAERLVDTEISYVLNKANLLQYEKGYGFKRVEIVNLDVNTCEKCAALEGEVFDIRDAPVLPIHPRCHCSYCVPEDGDDAEITASGADLDAVYARKGVKGYGQAKQYAPKGAKAAQAQPIPASKLEAKVDEALAGFERPEVVLEKAAKANPQAPAVQIDMAETLSKAVESAIITPSTEAAGDGVHSITRIENEAITKRWGNIVREVVLTDERIEHIREGHAEDYDQYGQYIAEVIHDPTYIFEDERKENTALFVKSIKATNISVVIRIEIAGERKDPELLSSVITMYRLGNRTLKRMIKKHPMLYNANDL